LLVYAVSIRLVFENRVLRRVLGPKREEDIVVKIA
jgi:hypothetical protein